MAPEKPAAAASPRIQNKSPPSESTEDEPGITERQFQNCTIYEKLRIFFRLSILSLLLLLPLELTLLTLFTPFTPNTWSPLFFISLIYLNRAIIIGCDLPIHISSARYVQETLTAPGIFFAVFLWALAVFCTARISTRYRTAEEILEPFCGRRTSAVATVLGAVAMYHHYLMVLIAPSVPCTILFELVGDGGQISYELAQDPAKLLKIIAFIVKFIDYMNPGRLGGDWTEPLRELGLMEKT